MSERADRPTGPVEVQNHPGVHLGTTVVNAVSEATGIPVWEMDAELNDFLDPDALDELFANRHDGTPRKGGRLVFSMSRCEICVYGDGRIVVTPE